MQEQVPFSALLAGTFIGAAQGKLFRDESPVLHAVFLDNFDESIVLLNSGSSTSSDQPLRDYMNVY